MIRCCCHTILLEVLRNNRKHNQIQIKHCRFDLHGSSTFPRLGRTAGHHVVSVVVQESKLGETQSIIAFHSPLRTGSCFVADGSNRKNSCNFCHPERGRAMDQQSACRTHDLEAVWRFSGQCRRIIRARPQPVSSRAKHHDHRGSLGNFGTHCRSKRRRDSFCP